MSDQTADDVLAFPIVGGVPSSPASWVLSVPNALHVNGLALDTIGDLFVAEDLFPNYRVAEYAPHASGTAAPVWTATVPAYATDVKLDVDANVYVGLEFDSVEIFAPGGSTPLQTIAAPRLRDIALDGAGDLYVANENGIDVYATPATSPTLTKHICTRNPVVGIAIDDATRSIFGSNYFGRHGSVNVFDEDTTVVCPKFASPRAIRPAGDPFSPIDLAVDGKVLYAANSTSNVFAFGVRDRGNVTPRSVLAATREPWGVAVGP